MNILISGGAGFIGSHLTEKLLSMDHTITIVDNFITGNEENIAHLLDNKNLTLVRADICDYSDRGWGTYDAIFNLASPASPVDYMRYPKETLMVGSVGIMNMLGLCTQNTRFIHASTSEVYGDPLEHPQRESYYGHVNSYGPRSCYDEAKRFAESMIYTANRKYGLNTGIVRIFNTYGPRMRMNDGRAIPNFLHQAMNGGPITVYGSGEQTRSFCYVDDMVRGLIMMMESDIEGPINLGNPEEITIHQLVDMVKTYYDQVSVGHYELPKDDPTRRCPDISRAQKELGWNPTIMIKEGLDKTIQWVMANSNK